MRVRGDKAPAKFSIEPQPNKPGFVLVRFFENVVPTEGGYEYDEFHLELFDTGQDDVEGNFNNLLDIAKILEEMRDPDINTLRMYLNSFIRGFSPGTLPDKESWHEAGTASRQGRDIGNLIFANMAVAGQIDNATVVEKFHIFPSWDEHWTGRAGSILIDNNVAFRALHNMETKSPLRPSEDTKGEYWERIGRPSDSSWTQPLCITEAYRATDMVMHKNKKWISDIDDNIYEPGIYGWSQTKKVKLQ